MIENTRVAVAPRLSSARSSRSTSYRPVNHHGFAFDVAARQVAPVAAVLRIVAVVPHDEVLVTWNGHRTVALSDVDRRHFRSLGAGRQEMHVRFVERLTVDVDLLGSQLDGIAGQADDSLDEVTLGLDRILEDDNVTPLDVTNGHDRAIEAGRRPEYELVDEQVVADEQVVLHRSCGDLERLHHPGAHEERENHRNDDGFEVLTDRRFTIGGCHHSWPTFSTARKASCGISTRPTRFMRFLPSFCFSSSLRLRLMSPP